ncbi:pRL2-23 [Streptomyces sp. ST2-7A]|uniref:pRL2-23 n=1 Tax=Streptomyces sp. ST2-7A TaxID=2907214 RepID=UPI001F3FDC87|nr:pRL2-23 [Streptomyces sp. ST2-7A]MCE7080447.1 pRL2-23 [Streptomyces sp. ST2-7A]
MWASIIAVIGTLAGATVAGLLQHRAARAGRTEERAAELRRDRITAVTELAASLSDHRRAMWELKDAELTDASPDRVRKLLDTSHETRSEITSPSVRVRLLVSDATVRNAAVRATRATYAIRDAADLRELESLRAGALEAHDAMVEAAGTSLR